MRMLTTHHKAISTGHMACRPVLMLYIARAAGADNSHNRKRQSPFHPSSQTVKQHVKEALEGSALLVMIDKLTQPGCLQVYHADLRSSTECCVLVCVSLLRRNSRRRRTLVKLFCSAAMSMSPQSSADESLWQAINADIGALQQIVSSPSELIVNATHV
jgi:hypothetical protein